MVEDHRPTPRPEKDGDAPSDDEGIGKIDLEALASVQDDGEHLEWFPLP